MPFGVPGTLIGCEIPSFEMLQSWPTVRRRRGSGRGSHCHGRYPHRGRWSWLRCRITGLPAPAAERYEPSVVRSLNRSLLPGTRSIANGVLFPFVTRSTFPTASRPRSPVTPNVNTRASAPRGGVPSHGCREPRVLITLNVHHRALDHLSPRRRRRIERFHTAAATATRMRRGQHLRRLNVDVLLKLIGPSRHLVLADVRGSPFPIALESAAKRTGSAVRSRPLRWLCSFESIASDLVGGDSGARVYRRDWRQVTLLIRRCGRGVSWSPEP